MGRSVVNQMDMCYSFICSLIFVIYHLIIWLRAYSMLSIDSCVIYPK